MSRRRPRKLVLVLVDSLRTDMLLKTVEAGRAPTFGALLERGELVGDCVSSYPSVTPVCTSEILTGVRPDRHRIPGMNWYHRAEARYVEYGSSFEATRAFGLFTALYDTVYNLNMAHLSPEVDTLYERVADAGLRSACTPFLIYRGRTRHELGLDGFLRLAVTAAKFDHAVWGPDELFYGELYASQKVDCKPTLARPNTRDEYSACVAPTLVDNDLFEFLLYSLPDNDYYSHKYGPTETDESIARADSALGGLADAFGGIDAFLEQSGVIVMADHSQSDVSEEIALPELLEPAGRVLRPADEAPEQASMAVGLSSRSAGVWFLREGSEAKRLHSKAVELLDDAEGVDLTSWLVDAAGEPVIRTEVGTPVGDALVVRRGEQELRFAPGEGARDRRGESWRIDGDHQVLELSTDGGTTDSERYPDPFSRLWACHHSPYASDLQASAALGYELCDWGGASHVPGGSHGSLLAEDSLGPLLTVGLDGERPEREQWSISDAHQLVANHFGFGTGR